LELLAKKTDECAKVTAPLESNVMRRRTIQEFFGHGISGPDLEFSNSR